MQSHRRKFIALDQNRDNKLSFEEVKETLRRMNLGKEAHELKNCFDFADKNEDGFLNFHEFLTLEQSKAQDKKTSTCEDDQSTQASSDGEADEKEDRVHDGENFDHWLSRVDGCRRRSSVGLPLVTPDTLSTLERTDTTKLYHNESRQGEERRRSMPSVLPPLSARPSSSSRRASDPSSCARRQSCGPDKFFYDRSTYTGVQAHCVTLPKSRKPEMPTFRQRRGSLSLNVMIGLCKDAMKDVHDTSSCAESPA
jgi:hypothetical protein